MRIDSILASSAGRGHRTVDGGRRGASMVACEMTEASVRLARFPIARGCACKGAHNAMRALRALVVIGLAFSVLAVPSAGLADSRVALVIGNSAYTGTSPLTNPVNDATDMAAALRELQFDVILERDADEDAMDDALADFEERSAGSDLALVFYAGHGMEMNGTNYLVPVDARLATAAAVERETIALDSVLAAAAGARTRIVILDACRNNPFARAMRGVVRANVRSGGLAAVSTGAGLLVAYAAAAGEVAADGQDSRNSPYTAALLEHLRSPGIEVRVMFGNVGGAVSASTRADQQPFVYTSLTGEHYLASRATQPVVANDSSLRRQETVFWESIRESTNPADFAAYKRRFPGGVFEELANNRIAALTAADPPRRPRPLAPAIEPEPAPAPSSAAGRVALVVGNSAYARGRLPNPGNDAADMAAALRRLGFEVTTALDADRVELNDALRAFTRQSAGADVSLVFYAGHGIEMDGVNYLVPVDARLERDTDVRFEAVELNYVLAATVGAGLRVVILDACRNNPLARSMQRTGASRSVSRGSFGDLDESLLGDETLVAYAAAAGTTAADGTGRNSPYTSALLEHLEQPLEVLTLFRRVRAQVLAATNLRQRPHEYQSLLREHYLSGVLTAATSVRTVIECAVKGAIPQRVRIPPGNCRSSR